VLGHLARITAQVAVEEQKFMHRLVEQRFVGIAQRWPRCFDKEYFIKEYFVLEISNIIFYDLSNVIGRKINNLFCGAIMI
jgi:hypothetical protein